MATKQPEAFWCNNDATFVPQEEVGSDDQDRLIHAGRSWDGRYCGAILEPRPFADPFRYIGQADPPPRAQ